MYKIQITEKIQYTRYTDLYTLASTMNTHNIIYYTYIASYENAFIFKPCPLFNCFTHFIVCSDYKFITRDILICVIHFIPREISIYFIHFIVSFDYEFVTRDILICVIHFIPREISIYFIHFIVSFDYEFVTRDILIC
eukprot:103887_1